MSISPEALQILDRMLEANQEYVGQLSGSVPRIAQELATLASDYSMYMLRSGLTSNRLAALDAQLQGVSASLHHVQFDLEQQLRDDVYALRLLQDVVLSAAQEISPMIGAVQIAVNTYSADMDRAHHSIGALLRSLILQLRNLATNIEIAAAHAGSSDASTQVDLFCTLATLLRTLADRLRAAADELRIFEQTQSGHAQLLRSVIARDETGAVA